MLRAKVDGTADWDEGSTATGGWELKFFYRTSDLRMWGCNHNDQGSTLDRALKCVDETNGPTFDPLGEAPNLQFDMVIQSTGQVNHYQTTVAKCSNGKDTCPGEERAFSGTITVMVAGTSGAEEGRIAKVSGKYVEEYAPLMITEDH